MEEDGRVPGGKIVSQDSLEKFGAYQKAVELFDFVVKDMEPISDFKCRRLITQQIASADSIGSNIEEGYGRGSQAEYVQFLRYARGSARETRGRYVRMKHWLPSEVVTSPTLICDEITGILNGTIRTLRAKAKQK